MPEPPVSYYEPLVSAYVRGRLGLGNDPVPFETIRDLISEHNLRKDVDKFKRKTILPRIQWVLDRIRARTPGSLMDLGCGRGTFLWPMIESFPGVSLFGVDSYEGRSKDLNLIRDHGITQIQAGFCKSVEKLEGISSNSVDTSTILEVLEHVEDPDAAAREALRVTRKTVYASVPSKPDYNPDHLRCFTLGTLKNTWLRAGGKNIKIEELGKHFVAEITKG